MVWHVLVEVDTVVSSTCVATGQPASIRVTINSLFSTAINAVLDSSLDAASFDPTYGFPTALHYRGPPDAAWSEGVAGFQN
jgi:hypothetical protein